MAYKKHLPLFMYIVALTVLLVFLLTFLICHEHVNVFNEINDDILLYSMTHYTSIAGL